MEQQEEQQQVEEQQDLVVAPELEAMAEAQVEAQPEEQPQEVVEEAKPERIKIGDQSFATQEEAWAFADEMAKERLAQDAYRQGIEDAKAQAPQVTSQPVQEDDFDEQFYADPKGYLEKKEQEILQRIEQKQAVKENEEKLWKQFYNENPNLVGKEKLVKTILNENWDVLGHMTDSNKALKLLAEATNKELKSYFDSSAPQTELPRVAQQVSSGTAQQVTSSKPVEKPLDFMSQLANHQKGKLF